MDEQPAGQSDQDAITSIVTMLLALAALAERASRRCHAVRCLVLWILRPAEARARKLVAEATGMPLQAFAEIPAIRLGHSPADAIRLALSFRALAAALDNLPRQALGFARWMAGFDRPQGERHFARRADISIADGSTMALNAGRPNDTS